MGWGERLALTAVALAFVTACANDGPEPDAKLSPSLRVVGRTAPKPATGRATGPSSATSGSVPPNVTAPILQALNIALRDKRVGAIVKDRSVALVEASEWTDGLGPSGGRLVGAMLGLSLDRSASIDAVFPGWICRHGRLRGISVRIIAANVKRIEVGVDVNTRRVLLVDPGRWAPGAQYRTLPGELRFPPMACDESD